MCSSISDFKPVFPEKNKIKKSQINEIKIERNPDILSFLGKNNRFKPKLLIGFSAETGKLDKKLKKKNARKVL